MSDLTSVQPDPGASNANIDYLLLGIYGWEYIHSLHVEWAVIRGRLAFRPSLIPYILGRICFLVFLILVAAATSPSLGVLSCQPGMMTIAVLVNVVMGCSSMNFMIRTWIIWKDSLLVHVVLSLLVLVQWIVLAVEVAYIKSININGVCIVRDYPQLMDALTFIYTVFLDLIVFVLSVMGLSNQRCGSPLTKRLRSQGILYIAVAGISYIPPVVFVLLGNLPVYFIVSDIASTISTIVSSWAVRSLYALDSSKQEESHVEFTTQIDVRHSMFHEDIP